MSTRFNTVHPGRAPLPGPPRFTTVVLTCQKPPERPPVHPGPSGIISVHHGGTTVQPPVLPGSPRSVDRGEPGSTGSPVGLGHKVTTSCKFNNELVKMFKKIHNLHLLPRNGITRKRNRITTPIIMLFLHGD